VYIDTTSGCAKATFDFGAAAVSRSYEIKVTLLYMTNNSMFESSCRYISETNSNFESVLQVTQYNCGDEFAGIQTLIRFGNFHLLKIFV
jgi:hypothetical protein